jgi:hypothetical protein
MKTRESRSGKECGRLLGWREEGDERKEKLNCSPLCVVFIASLFRTVSLNKKKIDFP